MNKILNKIETPLQTSYSSKKEYWFFGISLVLFFCNRYFQFSAHSSDLGYIIYASIFETLAYLSVVMIALPIADKVLSSHFCSNQLLLVPILIVNSSLLYFIVGWLLGFSEFIQWRVDLENFYWMGCPWYISWGISALSCFFGVRTMFLLASLRPLKGSLMQLLRLTTDTLKFHEGFMYNISHNADGDLPINPTDHYFLLVVKFRKYFYSTLLSGIPLMINFGLNGFIALLGPIGIFILIGLARLPIFHQNFQGVCFGDALTAALGAGFLIAYQTSMPLVWAFNLAVAVILIVHGTKFGRSHFHYSFIPKKLSEIVELVLFTIGAILIFMPLAWAVGFVDINEFSLNVSLLDLFKYSLTWVYLVGIAEEVIFRVILLIFIKDGIEFLYTKFQNSPTQSQKIPGWLVKIHQTPMFSAMIIAAIVFGLSHISKGVDYAFLAIIAGLLYGYPFVKNKNLFGAILMHAIVDVIAVAFLGAQL